MIHNKIKTKEDTITLNFHSSSQILSLETLSKRIWEAIGNKIVIMEHIVLNNNCDH